MGLFLIIITGFFLIGILYVIFTLLLVPGLAEERLGTLEELSPDAAEWRDEIDTPAAKAAAARGLRRQTRVWRDPMGDWLGRERLLRQVRLLDADGEVVEIEPERRVRRRRVRGS